MSTKIVKSKNKCLFSRDIFGSRIVRGDVLAYKKYSSLYRGEIVGFTPKGNPKIVNFGTPQGICGSAPATLYKTTPYVKIGNINNIPQKV